MKVSLGLNNFAVKNMPQARQSQTQKTTAPNNAANSVSFGYLFHTKARTDVLSARYANWLTNHLWDKNCNDEEAIVEYFDGNFKRVLEGYPVGTFKYAEAADIEIIYEGIKHLKKSGEKGEMVYNAFVNRLIKNPDEFDRYGYYFSAKDQFPLNSLADALKKYKLKTTCSDNFIKQYDQREQEDINITEYMGPN